jgi:antitoxin component YwqK of YwqJK toxin-antitoxin module
MKRNPTTHRIAYGGLAAAVAIALSSAAPAQQRSQFEFGNEYGNSLLSDEDQSVPAHIHNAKAGEIEVVRERYSDGSVRIERQVTQDEDGNYVNHGAWKMLTPGGEVSAQGQFNMGERVGLWTRWHNREDSPILSEVPFNRFRAPFQSQVNFTDGVMDGEWLITDANQKKCMQITLKAGRRDGPAITWLVEGKIYRQATYEQGVPVGDVMEINAKTSELVRADSYVDGKRVITKTSYHPNSQRQKKSETMYLAATTVQQSPDEYWDLKLARYASEGKDLKHGPSKAWFINGKSQFDGFYQLGLRTGTFTYWHQNGQVAATGEYKDDRASGIWVWFHPNGQKSAIGRYEDGSLIGEWRWWAEDGRLTKSHEYDGTESISSQGEDSLDIGLQPDEAEPTVR